MPKLPKGTPWSLVRVRRPTNLDDRTEPVDPSRGVPLIRLNSPGSPYFFAETRFGEDYAYLFNARSTRILFRRPFIPAGAQEIHFSKPLLAADPYVMAAAYGLFPREAMSHTLRPLSGDAHLKVNSKGGLTLEPSEYQMIAPRMPKIVEGGKWGLSVKGVETPPSSVVPDFIADVEPDIPWKVNITGKGLLLDVESIGEVVEFIAGIDCDELLDSDFGLLVDDQIKFKKDFGKLQRILSAIDKGIGAKIPISYSFKNNSKDSNSFRFVFEVEMKIEGEDGKAS